ncbi:glycosyltransferase [Pontibacter sp. JH31]|uniref:Glycosyltransferase n=1 Tax=Pontibacter aquaedesilientis TaxID=2766980 RepID=A0ABR7XFB5_9BACT|nr:glycosyltransferase [Pontibacter aquaedesilientis]MBD1396957.1 glycosyltransferase [Pontibacter aquaedesilientis]
MKLLFVTWNGPDVTYIEGLFLPIFERLSKQYAVECHILQFTWGNEDYVSRVELACKDKSCYYEVIKVNRRFVPAALLKANLIDSKKVKKYIQKHGIDIVMPRATVAAAIVLKAIDGLHKVRLLFDADGLQQDERVDFSGWEPSGLQYRIYRDIEFKALRRSDGVLVRSNQAKLILASRAGALFNENIITVINNGRDKNLFAPKFDEALKKEIFNSSTEDFPVLVYAGSIGPQYCFDEMMYIFSKVHQLNSLTKFLILTGQPEIVEKNLEAYNTLRANCLVKKVAAEEVPIYLSIADIAFALRRPTFSMKAVAPIKLGEYLLCGVPVLATKGIGDTELYIQGVTCAHMLTDLETSHLDASVQWVYQTLSQDRRTVRDEARRIGERYFDLEKTVSQYMLAIQSLG